MKNIFAAIILSTAAIGAAQAGELGYLDTPSTHSQAATTRADVQNALNADRAKVDAFQGELNPVAGTVANTAASNASGAKQASIASPMIVAKGEGNPDDTGTAVAFVNG